MAATHVLSHRHVPDEVSIAIQEAASNFAAASIGSENFREGTPERLAASRAVGRAKAALVHARNNQTVLSASGRIEFRRAMLILGMACTSPTGAGINVGALDSNAPWEATEFDAYQALNAWRAVNRHLLDSATLHTITECAWDDWILFLKYAMYRNGFTTVGDSDR